jgi:putative hydrolase of the HAD superfamily
VLRAVVFDFDGVIIDTEWAAYCTWRSLLADHDADLSIEEFATCIGTRGALDFSALIERKTGKPAPSNQQLRAWKQPIQDVAVADLPLLPGVLDWLDAAAAAGTARAIASSSERWWIEPHLARHDIAHHFSHLSTWDGPEVGYSPKPAPDIYTRCVESLGIEPTQALAIEDSVNGCNAAKAAGLWCLAVPTQLTAHLDFSMADHVVESLTGCTLANAIERLESR